MLGTNAPLAVAGRVGAVAWIGATALHPGWRGRVLSMARKARTELRVSTGFPTERMLRVWQRVDTYKESHVVDRLGLRVRPLATGRGWVDAWAVPADSLASGVRRWWRPRGIAVTEMPRFPGSWDQWLAEATRTWPVTLARSAATCNWLYTDDPLGPHRILAVERGGAPAGFAVVEVHGGERTRTRAYLCDLFARSDDPAALDAALGAAVDHARSSGAIALRVRDCRHPVVARVLARHAFLHGRSDPLPMILARRPEGAPSGLLEDPRSWALPGAWADPRWI
jgi:hypothetical protein